MTGEQTGPPEVETIEARAERLDDVESLWRAMLEYQAEVAGEAREVAPFRRAEDSWQRRRGDFERWMRAGEAWLLIAEREGSPVGFALFRICEGDWSFETSERMGELEALSVEPELRRWGIGSLLMEEVERRLAAAGVGFIGLALIVERYGVGDVAGDQPVTHYDGGPNGRHEERCMPLYLDIHTVEGGVSAADAADAHMKDVETQGKYGVNYQRYWVDAKQGKIFCLVEAPDAETAHRVHREAHGLVADEIYEVQEGE